MSLIEVRDLVKIFQQKKQDIGVSGALVSLLRRSRETIRAVDGITFSVEQGEFVGYIGPNGAGKSTTIKMLSGILHPTSGNVLVDGLVPHEYRRQNAFNVGVVFGQRSQLWWDLPIGDTYNLLAYMYELKPSDYQERLALLKELLGLHEFWDRPVRQLSLGQRMRGELGAALLHRPKIIYLDEPTIGMDALVKERIRQFLLEINRRDEVTIILTTHDLEEIERTCPRVTVINQGKLLFDGQMADLRARCPAPSHLVVDFYECPPAEQLEAYAIVSQESNRVTFAFQRNHVSATQLIEGIMTRFSVRDVAIQEPAIETVVRDLYQARPGEE